MTVQELDEHGYRKVKNRVASALSKLNVRSVDVEDVTQSVLLAWLSKGGSSSQLTKHAVIDYLRTEFGNTRSNTYAQRFALATAIPISNFGNEEYPGDPAEIFDRFAGFHDGAGEELDYQLIRSLLGPKRRFIFEMILEGYTLREIGEDLGVTESRVSQMFKRMCKEIRAYVP